jgi:protease-4
MGTRGYTVIRLRPEEPPVEVRRDLPFLGRRSRSDLWSVLQVLRGARSDRRIAGLLLDVGAPGFRGPVLGWSKIESLRRALGEIRAASKPTVAFIERGGPLQYLLALACEKIVIAPAATLSLVGLRAEAFFFKDLLEGVGLEPQIEAVGEFKSAADAFTRREMSPFHREQLESVLAELEAHLAEALSRSRGLGAERARTLLLGGPYLAEECLALGLVDSLGHPDSCRQRLEEQLGGRVLLLSHDRYPIGDGLWRRLLTRRRPQIALLHVTGLIGVPGGLPGRARSTTKLIGEQLQRARESKKVKAIVVRIESPGGDAIASDLIWREMRLAGEKKPLVVSLGDVAASGGYYIATAGQAIVAESSTLTGSIGVLGGKIVGQRLLDKLGIHRESVFSGSRSGFGSPFEPYSSAERETLRGHLMSFYQKLFLPRVAEGRRLSTERVHEIGRGRVWTGKQGREIGLVDALGDLALAIDLAREKAGIAPEKKYRVVAYLPRRRLGERLLSRLPWRTPPGAAAIAEALEIPELFELFELAWSSEALFLAPWWLRIR